MEIRFFSDSFLMHFDLLGFTYLLVVSPLLLRQTVLYTANDPDTSEVIWCLTCYGIPRQKQIPILRLKSVRLRSYQDFFLVFPRIGKAV